MNAETTVVPVTQPVTGTAPTWVTTDRNGSTSEYYRIGTDLRVTRVTMWYGEVRYFVSAYNGYAAATDDGYGMDPRRFACAWNRVTELTFADGEPERDASEAVTAIVPAQAVAAVPTQSQPEPSWEEVVTGNRAVERTMADMGVTRDELRTGRNVRNAARKIILSRMRRADHVQALKMDVVITAAMKADDAPLSRTERAELNRLRARYAAEAQPSRKPTVDEWNTLIQEAKTRDACADVLNRMSRKELADVADLLWLEWQTVSGNSRPASTLRTIILNDRWAV